MKQKLFKIISLKSTTNYLRAAYLGVTSVFSVSPKPSRKKMQAPAAQQILAPLIETLAITEELIPNFTTHLNPIINIIIPEVMSQLSKASPGKRIVAQLNYICGSIIKSNINYKLEKHPLQQLISKTKKAYEDVKSNLSKNNKTDQALNWNVRSEKLFIWCNIVIQEVVYAPFKGYITSKFGAKASIVIKELPLIGTKMAIFDTLVDDIADNLQDKSLLNIFCNITCQKEVREATRRTDLAFIEKNYPSFIDYYLFTTELWEDIETSLSQLREHTEHEASLDPLISELISTMHFSVDMNLQLHSDSEILKIIPIDDMEVNLSSNMMVKILFNFLFHQSGDTVITNKELLEDIDNIVKKIERAFSKGNMYATRRREAKEGDATNTIFELTKQSKLSESAILHLRNRYEHTFRTKAHTEFSKFFTQVFKRTQLKELGNEFKKVESLLLEKNIIKQSLLEGTSTFGEGMQKLMDVLVSGDIQDEDSEEIFESAEQYIYLFTLERERISLIQDMMVMTDAEATFFQGWQDLHTEICKDIDTCCSKYEASEFEGKTELFQGLQKMKENNIVFLSLYMIFSQIKGTT